MSKKSIFVVEGPEFVGKSTFVKRLGERLRHNKEDVMCYRSPGSTKLGEEIRDILVHNDDTVDTLSQVMLFFANHFQFINRFVLAEDAPEIILVDRFDISTVIYQYLAHAYDKHHDKEYHDYVRDNLPRILYQLQCTLRNSVDIHYFILGADDNLERLSNSSYRHDRYEQYDDKFHEELIHLYKSYPHVGFMGSPLNESEHNIVRLDSSNWVALSASVDVAYAYIKKVLDKKN